MDLGTLTHRDTSWFYTLYEPNQWLSSEEDYEKSGGLIEWEKYDVLRSYVLGDFLICGKHWSEAEFACIPVHVEILDHWIWLVVDISLRSIVVYDSFKGRSSHNKLVDKKCSMVAKCLSHLLQAVDGLDGKLYFEHVSRPSSPQVKDRLMRGQDEGSWSSGDCGMFIIKYTEFLISDKPVSKVTAERMKYFHHKLACELYNHGLRKYKEYVETDRDE
ncbi:Ulp1 protease family, C-terminal catalytic domain containing protein [Trema orientale]|uniref:Ulp1 protease family, C-terminal catalytic domain containing protein n=1 Tax=Trema orientale TaxID=63057 RepID=A0A2P5ED31_TREOI|nr:Ulp1 protease family, C-terminal catalytic domain containing protein [Trema orientale]